MSRRDCVIISSESDYHSCAIRFAVRAAGGVCDIVDTTKLIHNEMPSASISLRNGNLTLGGLPFSSRNISIWPRRVFRSREVDGIPHAYVDYIRNESLEFERNLFKNLQFRENCHWVNKIPSIYASEIKSYQLAVASRCGLSVPDTLISSHPDSIREFCDRFSSVVLKPFTPHTWQDLGSKKRWTTFANIINRTEIALLDDAELCASPCIFQEYIPTVADVRVAILGNGMLALEMRHTVQGRIDFRTMDDDEMAYSGCIIPSDVAQSLQKLMSELDITIASADFILGKDGRWHFIELNPSGAFLFLEDRCPEIRVLSAAASLLCYGDVKPDHAQEFPCLEDFVGSEDHRRWSRAFENHRLTSNAHLTHLS